MAVDIQALFDKQMELSFTPPHGFYMVIEKLPATMFTLQRVQIPVISGQEVSMPSPMNPNNTMMPGTSMEYSVLSCDFILDKHLKNYREIMQWFKGNYAPEDKERQAYKWQDAMSNITVVATDAANVPLMHWQFYDSFPISIDGPMFDATMPDMEYLTSNVTFRHKYFTFATYTNGTYNHDDI